MPTATDTKPEAEATPTPEAPKFHDCGCFSVWDEKLEAYVSCGEQVPAKRTFVPGHDAKLKSVLLKAFREGEAFTYVSGGLRVEADPLELAKERGWEKFMTPKPVKKSKAKADKDEPAVPAEPADVKLEGFHPATFKVGRWDKEGSVVSENADGTLTVSYKDGKGNEQTLTLPADKVQRG